MGGHSPRFDDLVLSLAGSRVCFLPTASGDESGQLVQLYERFGPRAEARHVSFHPWPRRDLRMCGWSAGMLCWFEAGVTDSFGPELRDLRDGLAFLPGSACQHYDSEEARRPVYRELVDRGFPPGYAADDGAALYFEGTALDEVVAAVPGVRAYRIRPGSEEPLEARLP